MMPSPEKKIKAFYEGSEVDKISSVSIVCNENIKKHEYGMHYKTVSIPTPILERINKEAPGSFSALVVGLLDYTLEELKKKNKTLIINRRP